MNKRYDRTAENIGNIVGLEHVNLQAPDQRLSTLFYISGLGLTRDPFLVTGISNMWVNVGRSQFHLPTSDAQRLRGRIGLVMPGLKALLMRLEGVSKALKDTESAYTERKRDNAVDVTCPWGNSFRCHAAGPQFAPVALGMAYVQFDVPKGTAKGIGRFYREIFNTPVKVDSSGGTPAAHVNVGLRQELIFRESKTVADYDGHHIQIYIANFSAPHERLDDLGLVSAENGQYQYRFKDIVDLDSGKLLFQIEHEVRSMTHPLYGRTLVNRNPQQTNASFSPGFEELAWRAPAAN